MQIGFNTAQNRNNVGFSGYLIHARAGEISKISDNLAGARKLRQECTNFVSRGERGTPLMSIMTLQGPKDVPKIEISEKIKNAALEKMNWIFENDDLFTGLVELITGRKEGKEGAKILHGIVANERKESGTVNRLLEGTCFKAIGNEESSYGGKFFISDLTNLAKHFETQEK